MELPTIERFNSWSLQEKEDWLYNYHEYRPWYSPDIQPYANPGFIFYYDNGKGMAIEYRFNKRVRLLKATATTLNEGQEVFEEYRKKFPIYLTSRGQQFVNF